MSVKFVFDEFAISADKEFDIVITGNLSSISSARSKIIRFLSNNQKTELKILLKSQSVLIRIRDLLDLEHVQPLYIVDPRQLLAAKLGYQPPIWLSGNIISKLQVLRHKTIDINQNFFLRDLLAIVDLTILQVKSFAELIVLICKKTDPLYLFLQISTFEGELVAYLKYELKVDEKASVEFVKTLKASENIINELYLLSHHQALVYLKNFASTHEITFSLPATEIHDSLVSLPLINRYSDESDLGHKFTNILELLISKAKPEEAKKALIKIIIFPWSVLINSLEIKIKANPSLVSKELINHLKTLESPLSESLAVSLEAKTKLNSLTTISENTDVKNVIDWSYKYFQLMKQEFESDELEYDTELANSFSDWLLSQKARIEKSKYDWRHVSEAVNESLAEGYITVVFMIDALSQIHNEVIDNILGEIDHLSYHPSIVFAPLPTITKIGKKSVLSGLLPNKTTVSDLDLLLGRYGNNGLKAENILILQDWKRTKSNQLTADTKLAVVYINELDDRLHKTPAFAKHARDAESIIRTVRKTIETWVHTSYSLDKNISFYITADHGVTSLNSVVKNDFEGKAGERVVELTKKPIQVPNNFYYLPSYTDSPGYIVPKGRASFDKPCALSHGGITPEEVLIPFIKLSTVSSSKDQCDFEVFTNILDCHIIEDKKWKLLLNISSNCAMSHLSFKVKSPFSGFSNFNHVSSSDTITVPLVVTSKHAQQGQTELHITFRYVKDSKTVERVLEFIVDIPKPLLQETESSKNFGAMFDL